MMTKGGLKAESRWFTVSPVAGEDIRYWLAVFIELGLITDTCEYNVN